MRIRSTRRDFLKTNATVLAGTAFAVGGAGRASAASSRNKYRIFSSGSIARLQLKNRLVRTAAAEGSSPEGRMNEAGRALYANLARGGVGLIITGHMVAARGGDAHANQTHIDDDQYLESVTQIADTIHTSAPDCRVVAQLSHAGPGGIIDPIAPSDMPPRSLGGKPPRTLSAAEIAAFVTQFASAINRAKAAGFDGVEIHAAHGYLLSTFLSPAKNRRTDPYGGSTARRVEIVRNIVSAARTMVGPDYPILIRVDGDGQGEGKPGVAAFAEMALELEKAGIDAVDISGSNAARTDVDSPERESYFLPYAEATNLKVPILLTGGNRSVERLEAILQKGRVQLVGFARPLIREPELPKRWREGTGEDRSACISCNGCLKLLSQGPVRCVQV